MTTKTKGAFGGFYDHDVIKHLRAELAKSRLMLSALSQHTGTTEEELLKICSKYLTEVRGQMKAKMDEAEKKE